MSIPGLVLAGAAVVVPMGGDVGMLGMSQWDIWCLGWFQPNTHSVWFCFGTCWFACVLHVLLEGSSPFLMEEWWEFHLKGGGHLQLLGCFCGHGMGIEYVGHHRYHLANLQQLFQQESKGADNLGWESGTQFFGWVWCAHGWLWCLDISLELWWVHHEREHLHSTSLCWVNTWWWHHSFVNEHVYLPGSWCWSVQEACGYSQLWRHGQRHRCGIILLQRHRRAVHILCWHNAASQV